MQRALELLKSQATDWGVELSPSQVSLLSLYADLLAEYELANVIGTKQRDKIVLEHLIDSLSCLTIEDLGQRSSIVDVGAGAGFPGIPLAVAQPQLRIVLLEAIKKKVRFLEYAQSILGLHNLEVLHERVENLGKDPVHRETFDIATSRALASLPVVLEYCAPLVRPGGTVVAMKARLREEELAKGKTASGELGLALREVKEVEYLTLIPQKERRLVAFDKVEATSRGFPRRVGSAKKRPLGS